MIFPYAYKVTNIITGEFYIGSRTKNVKLGLLPEQDLLIKYFTSGSLEEHIREAPEKYNSEILFQFGDNDIVFWYEQLLIREYFDNSLCKNKTYLDIDTHKKAFNCPVRPPVSQKTRRLQSLAKKGCVPWNKGKTGLQKPKFTKEWRQRISDAKRGKPQSPEHIEKLAVTRRGRKMSKESSLKKSLATTGKSKPKIICPHCNKEGGNGSMQRWHFDNCKERII